MSVQTTELDGVLDVLQLDCHSSTFMSYYDGNT